jgi:hypothetical protein
MTDQSQPAHPQPAAPPPAPAHSRPAYTEPQVISYTDAALLEALGPAQAGGTYTVFGGP